MTVREFPEFDPTVSLSGTILFPLSDTDTIELWNESNVALLFETTYGDHFVLPPWTADVVSFPYVVTDLDWTQKFILLGNAGPISKVYGLVYSGDEQVRGNFPVSLSRNTYVGNSVAVTNPQGQTSFWATDAGTSVALTVISLAHLTTGVPAAVFGGQIQEVLQDTSGTGKQVGLIRWEWVDPTEATRKPKHTFWLTDTATRQYFQADSDGTQARIGWFGIGPIARPSALTQTYVTVTRTLPAYTPNVQSAAYTGIASGVAGTPYAQLTDINALRVAYENLRTQFESLMQFVNSITDDLQAYGLER